MQQFQVLMLTNQKKKNFTLLILAISQTTNSLPQQLTHTLGNADMINRWFPMVSPHGKNTDGHEQRQSVNVFQHTEVHPP